MSVYPKRDGSTYRYTLSRGPWLGGEGTVLFVMLNPSTADETQDDPTIRRCIGFAQSWGYANLIVGNLYALRATDPAGLFASDDPVGRENDRHLVEMGQQASEIIAAWGASPQPFPRRPEDVLWRLEFFAGPVRCLGLTKDGHPRHPLYVRRDATRIPFSFQARRAA